jgi:rhodanese-related sulfurtransferase
MDEVLKKMNLQFLANAGHKITATKFLEKQGAIFLDVRAKEEVETLRFDFKHFNILTLNIPVDELPDRYEELPKDTFIGTFCSSATRSAWAYIYLLAKGFDVRWIEATNEEFAAMLKPGLIFKAMQ